MRVGRDVPGPHQRAVIAVAHAQPRIMHTLLSRGDLYADSPQPALEAVSDVAALCRGWPQRVAAAASDATTTSRVSLWDAPAPAASHAGASVRRMRSGMTPGGMRRLLRNRVPLRAIFTQFCSEGRDEFPTQRAGPTRSTIAARTANVALADPRRDPCWVASGGGGTARGGDKASYKTWLETSAVLIALFGAGIATWQASNASRSADEQRAAARRAGPTRSSSSERRPRFQWPA